MLDIFSSIKFIISIYLGTSPANSGTIESVFFDEPISQKIIIKSDTIKLDILLQTKTLSEKVKFRISFGFFIYTFDFIL